MIIMIIMIIIIIIIITIFCCFFFCCFSFCFRFCFWFLFPFFLFFFYFVFFVVFLLLLSSLFIFIFLFFFFSSSSPSFGLTPPNTTTRGVSREKPQTPNPSPPPKKRWPSKEGENGKLKLFTSAVCVALFEVVILGRKTREVNDFVEILDWAISGVCVQRGFKSPYH